MAFIDGLGTDAQLELIYIGYYGRAADGAGFDFWEAQNTNAQKAVAQGGLGQSSAVALTNIANSFAPQAETAILYPTLVSNLGGFDKNSLQTQTEVTNFVNAVYQNLFNHAPDAPGLAYWKGQILDGIVPLGKAILAIANGASVADAAILTSKISAASYFTTQTTAAGIGIGGNAPANAAFLAEAALIVSGVTDAASATAAQTATNDWIAANPTNPGKTFTLTTGTDLGPAFVGTGLNDTFNAPLAGPEFGNTETLTAFDTLDGAGGTKDTLNVFADSNITIPTVSVKNIEIVNINATQDVNGDISSWQGVVDVTVKSGDDVGNAGGFTTAATGTVTINAADDVGTVTANSANKLVATSTSETASTFNATAAKSIDVTNSSATPGLTTINAGSPDTVKFTANADVNADLVLNATTLKDVTTTNADDVTINATTAAGGKITIANANFNGGNTNINITNLNEIVRLENWSENATSLNIDTSSTTVGLEIGMREQGGAGLNINAITEVGVDNITTLNVNLIANSNLNFDLDAMTALNISGTGNLGNSATDRSTAVNSAALQTIISTTTGNVYLDVNGATKPDVTTGGGDDVIVAKGGVGAAQDIITGGGNDLVDLTEGGILNHTFTADGGAGDKDVLRLDANDLQAPSPASDYNANVKGFEILSLDNALGTATTNVIDVRDYAGSTGAPQTVVLEDGFSNVWSGEVRGLAPTGGVIEDRAATGGGTLTVTLTDSTGPADQVMLKLLGGSNGNAGGFGNIDASGIERIDLVVSTDTGLYGVGTGTLVQLTDTSLKTLNITETGTNGAPAAQVNIFGNATNSLSTLNASTLVDNGVIASFSGNAGPVTVTTGGGADDITGTSKADTITLGAGGDRVFAGLGTGGDKIDLGSDSVKDVVAYTAVAQSAGGNTDVITHFGSQDVLELSPVAGAVVYKGDAIDFATGSTSLAGGGQVGAFLDQSTSIVYIDITGDGSIGAGDMTIQLVGVTNLLQANFG